MQLSVRASCSLRLQQQDGGWGTVPPANANTQKPLPVASCMHTRGHAGRWAPGRLLGGRGQESSAPICIGRAAGREKGRRKWLRAASPHLSLHLQRFTPAHALPSLGGTAALFCLLLSKPHPHGRGWHSASGRVELPLPLTGPAPTPGPSAFPAPGIPSFRRRGCGLWNQASWVECGALQDRR